MLGLRADVVRHLVVLGAEGHFIEVLSSPLLLQHILKLMHIYDQMLLHESVRLRHHFSVAFIPRLFVVAPGTSVLLPERPLPSRMLRVQIQGLGD